MSNIARIYPESKSGLIKWIEDNFHEIDEFIFVAEMKDNSQMAVYDYYSYRGALGSIEMAKEVIQQGDFIPKKW